MQMKRTIVRLLNQNKSIREIAGTFRVAKSTVWYILRKKKECTGELSNIKSPGCPLRTTVVDDRRILSNLGSLEIRVYIHFCKTEKNVPISTIHCSFQLK